jgi:hypothetical protein
MDNQGCVYAPDSDTNTVRYSNPIVSEGGNGVPWKALTMKFTALSVHSGRMYSR